MEQRELIRRIADILSSLGIPHFVTGSHASFYYGEMRSTYDIDMVVDIRYDQMDALLQQLPTEEFFCQRQVVIEAIQRRFFFNILHEPTGLRFDMIVLPKGFHENMCWKRTRRIDFDAKGEVPFISPEDLIIKKMEFYKEGEADKHLRDISSMILVQGKSLDYEYILYWIDQKGLRDVWRKIKDATGLKV